jgi:quinol monooxygenase YgiN
MLAGLIIEYEYDNDEDAWGEVIVAFLQNIADDEKLAGRFSYLVMRKADSPTSRVHIPRWDSPDTLAHLQAQPWFKEVAAQIEHFAGDTLKTTRMSCEFDSVSFLRPLTMRP